MSNIFGGFINHEHIIKVFDKNVSEETIINFVNNYKKLNLKEK